MIGISHDDVVENFDFEKLACSDEVTGDFDVGLGWCRFFASRASNTCRRAGNLPRSEGGFGFMVAEFLSRSFIIQSFHRSESS